MRKSKLIGIVLVTLLSLGVVSVYAKGGNPFDELWGHIFGIDTQVAEMQAKLDTFQEMLDNGSLIGPRGYNGTQGIQGPVGLIGPEGPPGEGSRAGVRKAGHLRGQ